MASIDCEFSMDVVQRQSEINIQNKISKLIRSKSKGEFRAKAHFATEPKY